jgi:hypothetical protein
MRVDHIDGDVTDAGLPDSDPLLMSCFSWNWKVTPVGEGLLADQPFALVRLQLTKISKYCVALSASAAVDSTGQQLLIDLQHRDYAKIGVTTFPCTSVSR